MVARRTVVQRIKHAGSLTSVESFSANIAQDFPPCEICGRETKTSPSVLENHDRWDVKYWIRSASAVIQWGATPPILGHSPPGAAAIAWPVNRKSPALVGKAAPPRSLRPVLQPSPRSEAVRQSGKVKYRFIPICAKFLSTPCFRNAASPLTCGGHHSLRVEPAGPASKSRKTFRFFLTGRRFESQDFASPLTPIARTCPAPRRQNGSLLSL